MSADYAPGTVAIATVIGVEGVRVSRYDGGWARLDDPDQFYSDNFDSQSGVAPWVTDIRPLVVLDLGDYSNRADIYLRNLANDDHEAVGGGVTPRAKLAHLIADQIDAQTKPPRIPEPGLWGVVEASMDAGTTRLTWVRTPEFWYTAKWDSARSWSDLIDPTLIREGVES